MSSSIWTRCGGSSNLRRVRAEAWRAVEAQHFASTRKLVSDGDEQELLEDMLEDTKPRLPESPPAGLHYLLSTAFRYPPLRHGSRLGSRHEGGIWYGALELPTAFAEVGYYRLLFLDGTAAELGEIEVELTAFSARIASDRGVDATGGAFAPYVDQISSRTAYDASQALGAAAREAGADLILFRSARCPRGGTNAGLLAPTAFAAPEPRKPQTWLCYVSPAAVEFVRKNVLNPRARERHRFARETFEVDGRLPSPAV